MSKFIKLILMVCVVAPVPGVVAQKNDRLAKTATSFITHKRDRYGNPVISITNRRFSYREFYPKYDGQSYWITLLEEFRGERTPGVEGRKSTIRVEGWEDSTPQKKLWTIRSEGDVGEPYDNFYRITKYGCCANITTQVWFNLATGHKVFTSTEGLMEVSVLGEAELGRYVAYHDIAAILQPEEFKEMKDLIGVIQYGSEKKTQKRLLVRARSHPGQPRIGILYEGKLHQIKDSNAGVRLRNIEGKNNLSALSDFSIELSWENGFKISIPVKNDELELGKAKVSDILTLENAKLSALR
jgi:hypothetical protein